MLQWCPPGSPAIWRWWLGHPAENSPRGCVIYFVVAGPPPRGWWGVYFTRLMAAALAIRPGCPSVRSSGAEASLAIRRWHRSTAELPPEPTTASAIRRWRPDRPAEYNKGCWSIPLTIVAPIVIVIWVCLSLTESRPGPLPFPSLSLRALAKGWNLLVRLVKHGVMETGGGTRGDRGWWLTVVMLLTGFESAQAHDYGDFGFGGASPRRTVAMNDPVWMVVWSEARAVLQKDGSVSFVGMHYIPWCVAAMTATAALAGAWLGPRGTIRATKWVVAKAASAAFLAAAVNGAAWVALCAAHGEFGLMVATPYSAFFRGVGWAVTTASAALVTGGLGGALGEVIGHLPSTGWIFAGLYGLSWCVSWAAMVAGNLTGSVNPLSLLRAAFPGGGGGPRAPRQPMLACQGMELLRGSVGYQGGRGRTGRWQPLQSRRLWIMADPF